MVLLHPDDGSVESWTAEGSAEKMRADFADFEPRCVGPRVVFLEIADVCLRVQRTEAFITREVDAEVASDGTTAAGDVGAQFGARRPARRRVPPYVGMSQRFSPISRPGLYCWFSRTLPKELQWQSRMQQHSVTFSHG